MLRRIVLLASLFAITVVPGPPAHAVHLFPALPNGFDPIGHTCGTTLSPAPASPAALVHVDGFFFVDDVNHSSSTAVAAGQTVSWKWDFWHCHSITFTSVPTGASVAGTFGGPNALSQVELARPTPDTTSDSFAVTFTTPGTYQYKCVHHASVGMVGTVVVS